MSGFGDKGFDVLGEDFRSLMANRDQWEFEYTASHLRDAAQKKKEYRQARAEWWQESQKKLIAEIRASGLEIDESVAAAYASNATRAPQIKVKADMQTKLGECHMKIREHLEAVREYDGWVQMLSVRQEILKLKHADWLFFFGAD